MDVCLHVCSIVRGLADEVNDQDLAELFSTCGKVVRAAVVWDNR